MVVAEVRLLDAFGVDELALLQEHLPLRTLFRLRKTNKQLREGLDASAPDAVAFVHWILDHNLSGRGDKDGVVTAFTCFFKEQQAAHDEAKARGDPMALMTDSMSWIMPRWDALTAEQKQSHVDAHEAKNPTMAALPKQVTYPYQLKPCKQLIGPDHENLYEHVRRVPTRTLLDAYRLFDAATVAIKHNLVARKTFKSDWKKGLERTLKSRVAHVIGGDGGTRGTVDPATDLLWTVKRIDPLLDPPPGRGPRRPLNGAESVTLLSDMIASGAVSANDEHSLSFSNAVTPFFAAAVTANVEVLKWLATHGRADVRWREPVHGCNAHEEVRFRVDAAVDFFTRRNLEAVTLTGDRRHEREQCAQDVDRVQAQVEREYGPVLRYLHDELGLRPRPPPPDTLDNDDDMDYEEDDEQTPEEFPHSDSESEYEEMSEELSEDEDADDGESEGEA